VAGAAAIPGAANSYLAAPATIGSVTP
jgi:hypothetical protein